MRGAGHTAHTIRDV